MWLILVMVALPNPQWDGNEPVFIFQEPNFEQSAECVDWVRDNPDYIARHTLNTYPDALGHKGIFCASAESLNQMYEDGVLMRDQEGTRL